MRSAGVLVIILWLAIAGVRAGVAALLEAQRGGRPGMVALLLVSALVSVAAAVAAYRRRRGAFPFLAGLAGLLLVVVLVRQHATFTLAAMAVVGVAVIAAAGVLSVLRRNAR